MKSLLLNGARNFVAKGNAARDRRDWEKAAEAYRKALRINKYNAPIWVQYGHALKESGQREEAEAAYRQALKLDPYNSDTCLQLGHVLKLQEKFVLAIKAYSSAVLLDSDCEDSKRELASFGWSDQDISGLLAKTGKEVSSLPYEDFSDELSSPAGYSEAFRDVRLLVSLGLIASPALHYEHYGRRQGRDMLLSLVTQPASRVFVLCPSFFKKCGIGEHARYLAACIQGAGYETHRIRTTRDLDRFSDEQVRDAVLIVNHGPGLFDGYNPELSEGEATVDLLATLGARFKTHNLRSILFMHSLIDRDNEVMFPRQQMSLEYPIPVVTTVEAAARVFNIFRVEHGMQPMVLPRIPEKSLRARDYPTIGFFGFFQWGGKNFDALFNVTRALKAKLVGSVATGNQEHLEKLREMLVEQEIRCDIGTGWVDDTELAQRLAEADFHYLPQHDYDHWNNSGTARFVMNFGRPVILPPHNPFLDLREYTLFADEQDLPALMAYLRDDSVYEAACERVRAYGAKHPMTVEMPKLVNGLHEIVSETGAANFINANMTSAFRLLGVSEDVFRARVAHCAPHADVAVAGAPDSDVRLKTIEALRANHPDSFGLTYPVVDDVQMWKNHYELEDFIFPTAFESFLNAYRTLAKREPSFVDRNLTSQIFGADFDPKTQVSVASLFRLLSVLLGRGTGLEFASKTAIYYRGQQLTPNMLGDLELAGEIEVEFNKRLKRCASIPGLEAAVWSGLSHVNMASVLALPSDMFVSAANFAARKGGLDCDFSAAAQKMSVLDRMMAVAQIIGNAGARITDIFVIDEPVVLPIDANRSIYNVADFWGFDGDFFLISAFRSLNKRNPTAQENFSLELLLQAKGKLEVLRALDSSSFANARIIDLDDANEALLSQTVTDLKPIVRQMRSPYAGGWTQRNAYLEAKRDSARLWLRLKTQKDIWWEQARQNVEAIVQSKN